uniref:Uncharacterized protein n=1 Tax=Cucumis melo TaxID=3656 RepID=A0A9I9D5N3_CUCME
RQLTFSRHISQFLLRYKIQTLNDDPTQTRLSLNHNSDNSPSTKSFILFNVKHLISVQWKLAARQRKAQEEEEEARRRRQFLASVKAGLQFPVGRIARYLKKGRYAQRVRYRRSRLLSRSNGVFSR